MTYARKPPPEAEDGAQVVAEALRTAATREGLAPRLRELYEAVARDVTMMPAALMWRGRANWAARQADAVWHDHWNELRGNGSGTNAWTSDNITYCYRKRMAVYDWRWGDGAWERALRGDVGREIREETAWRS